MIPQNAVKNMVKLSKIVRHIYLDTDSSNWYTQNVEGTFHEMLIIANISTKKWYSAFLP